MIHTDPSKRHELVLLFDVKNGNPNGDPDAGNLPRIDPETMHGLVTDVCLKRKVRDYVGGVLGKPIFIQSQVALNTLIHKAFKEEGIEPAEIELTDEEQDDEDLLFWLESKSEADFSLDSGRLFYSGDSAKQRDIERRLTEGLEDEQLRSELRGLSRRLADSAKKGAGQGITNEVRERARDRLCGERFDIRMFGAVLSTGLNAGQVRGPVQLTFGRSLDPILPLDLSITRQARTTTERMRTGTTEMGRKPIVPYGVYRAHGFFNPFLAKQTQATQNDLEDLWDALTHLFDFDRSAARPEMAVQGLWVFSHENSKGNAPAHKLFDLIRCRKINSTHGSAYPRSFRDYILECPEDGPLDAYGFPGVTLKRLV
jgi:CRISPR-associated protein Csd2